MKNLSISHERFYNAIAKGEGQHLEFKAAISKEIAREMVAFANTNWGDIIIGVGDDGRMLGTEVTNRTRSRLQEIASSCDPPIYLELDEYTDEGGRKYFLVHIEEGENKPYRCTNGIYVRRGANSEKLTTTEIVELIQSEGRVQFDSRVIKIRPWNELFNQESVGRYKRLIGYDQDLEILLINLRAIERIWPTNAGLLMFGTRPIHYIPQALVRCIAFSGTAKTDILDTKDFGDDLISNIENTIVFLKRHLNESRYVKGIEGRTELEIPEEVLREAVVNALLHRDYLIEGANVVVEVFVDRVVISSPGGLPKGLSESEFGSRSVARNPILAEMLLRTPYIEKLGTGVPRMRHALAKADLAEPEFTFTNFVTVKIFRPGYPTIKSGQTTDLLDVADSQWDRLLLQMSGQISDQISGQVKERLIATLKALLQQRLNANQLAAKHDVPVDTLRNDLNRLKAWGIIVFTGSRKTGGYVLTQESMKRLTG